MVDGDLSHDAANAEEELLHLTERMSLSRPEMPGQSNGTPGQDKSIRSIDADTTPIRDAVGTKRRLFVSTGSTDATD